MSRDYEDLVKAMPDIARVVNEFSSEAAQQAALAALLVAFNGGSGARPKVKGPLGSKGKDDEPGGEDAAVKKAAAKRAVKSASSGRSTLNNGSRLKDLDLQPKNLESFSDFSARAKPKSQVEEVLVAAYWLSHIASFETVSIDHVFTCFRAQGWTLPVNLGNTISQAGSKGLLKDSKRDAITLSPTGLNHVEQTMFKRTSETA